jgi:hypothetical protein
MILPAGLRLEGLAAAGLTAHQVSRPVHDVQVSVKTEEEKKYY